MSKSKNVITLPSVKPVEVRGEIKRIATEDTSLVIFLDHAVDRQDQRFISNKQIMNVLRNGDQIGDVWWCVEKEKGFRCKLKRVTAGAEVTVIAKLVERENRTCLVVSTWADDIEE